jgi:hypothetical protein
MRRYADGSGSPSAKAAIQAWSSRAEAGAPGIGSAESLADLVRALSRLTYSRALFGFAKSEDDDSLLDVRMQYGDVSTALLIEADLVLFYELDEAGTEKVAEARTDVAGKTFGTLEIVFGDLFA